MNFIHIFQSFFFSVSLCCPLNYCPGLQLCFGRKNAAYVQIILEKFKIINLLHELLARSLIILWFGLFHHKMEIVLLTSWVTMRSECDHMWEYLLYNFV